jgi:hypothetical protein
MSKTLKRLDLFNKALSADDIADGEVLLALSMTLGRVVWSSHPETRDQVAKALSECAARNSKDPGVKILERVAGVVAPSFEEFAPLAAIKAAIENADVN